MELSTFFFGYTGLFMAMLEYEMRYYLKNGEYLEGMSPNYSEPLGITPSRERILTILLAINLFCSICMAASIAFRYYLLMMWKI
jgi:hypothetical protein